MKTNYKEIASDIQPRLANVIWTVSLSHWGCIQVFEFDDYMFRKFRLHIFY
jgi:hypothetical protein